MEDNLEFFKLKADAELRRVKDEREKRIKEYWKTLPKFIIPYDVPDLPKVDQQEWKDYYIPKLIEAGAIPKMELIENQPYIGNHRNAQVAKWNGQRFVYRRTKWNHVYDDECNHFEDDDGFALFVPIGLATEEQYQKNSLL
jgi:hypothetical protein